MKWLRHALGLYTIEEAAAATNAVLEEARAIGQREGYSYRASEEQASVQHSPLDATFVAAQRKVWQWQ